MFTLPDGWRSIRGVSSAGWDIWLATAGPARFSLWSRTMTTNNVWTPFTLRALYSSDRDGTAAIEGIQDQLFRGERRAEMLFPEEPMTSLEQFGRF